MKGEVIKGELTYFDTSVGVVHITDKDDGRYTPIKFEPKTNPFNFEGIIGADVTAIVIDDQLSEIFLIEEEE